MVFFTEKVKEKKQDDKRNKTCGVVFDIPLTKYCTMG